MIIFLNLHGEPEALTAMQLESYLRLFPEWSGTDAGAAQWKSLVKRGITAGFDRRESNPL